MVLIKGECAKIASEGSFILNEDFSNEKAINDELELKSSVEIYPGQEQLLSLVAKIEFKSLNDICTSISLFPISLHLLITLFNDR